MTDLERRDLEELRGDIVSVAQSCGVFPGLEFSRATSDVALAVYVRGFGMRIQRLEEERRELLAAVKLQTNAETEEEWRVALDLGRAALRKAER